MSFGIWELMIVLVIVALLFGTSRLRNIGGDLGTALRGFRSAMGDDNEKKDAVDNLQSEEKIIEGEVESASKSEQAKQV